MGKGLFARETIQPGELILAERPLVLMPIALPHIPGKSPYCPDQFLEQLSERLDDDARRDFYRLHNCKGPSVLQIRGIMDTNVLSVGLLPGPYTGEHGAICRAISRINHRYITFGTSSGADGFSNQIPHSCSPNAEPRSKTNSMSLSKANKFLSHMHTLSIHGKSAKASF